MTAAKVGIAVFGTTRLHGARCSYTCGCADTPEGFFKFPMCAAEIHQSRFPASDDIDIDLRKQRSVVPVNFSDKTLDPVTDDGTANLLTYRYPEARVSEFIGVPDNKKPFDRIFVWNTGKL